MKAAIIVLLTAAIPLDPAFAQTPDRKKVGQVLLTFYWIADESSSRYDGKRETRLLDTRGGVIARVHSRFRRDLIMEGTGWLRDGRTVMYARKVGGVHRFRITKSRYGITATGCQLNPYRTAAIDPRFIKLGSKIYIPQLKGTTLPDGTIHDGVFTANDRGKFRGAHVDIFVGAGPGSTKPFARHGYRSRSRVTVYVEGSTVRRCDR